MRVIGSRWVLARSDFPQLFTALRSRGYRVVGPTVRDNAIVYGDLTREDDLPIGWTDRQEAGTYRLEPREDRALFGYNVGPHGWKKYLFPPRERLFTAHREAGTFRVTPEPLDSPPLALLGARACEIAAVKVQDRVFLGGPAVDPGYMARRQRLFVVAVQCGQAGGTCFCVSMGTGPGVRQGFDLSLTELLSDGPHRFILEVGSAAGAEVAAALPLAAASAQETHRAETLVEQTAQAMGRKMDTVGIHDLLLGNLTHPEWDDVGKRCLSCTNCTMACPTCFCHSPEEVPDLKGENVERHRRWDSCFNLAFTEVHLGSVRTSPASRYRQWMTHKLATWHDQFDSSGCVGCGRCITWCPVGIDLTSEVAAIRGSPKAAEVKGVTP